MRRETIWRASVLTTAEAEDAVAELLATHFAPGPSSYTDVETGQVNVSAYTATPPKQLSYIKHALQCGLKEIKTCGLSAGPATVTIQRLPRKNWAEAWKLHFKAIEIGRRLLVKPSWIRRPPKPGQALIVLDPGLSFGTGQHPTTEFCLRELVKHRDKARSQSVLDIGTGSGILAIAAAKLGYAPVHALDYDRQSVLVARENAAKNRATYQVKFTRADLTKLPHRSPKKYDVVCANLLADILVAEHQRILARVKPDGVLVAAGILKREFDEVQRAYERAGWQVVASKAENEWRSGSLVKYREVGS